MSDAGYYLIALILLAAIAWQLVAGFTSAPPRYAKKITRQDRPGLCWIILAAQGAVLVLFLLTSRSWTLR